MNVEPVRAPSEKRASPPGRRPRISALAPVCAAGVLAALAACGGTPAAPAETPIAVPVEPPVPEPVPETAPGEVVVPLPVVPVSACPLRDFHDARTFVVEAWGVPDPEFNVGEELRLQMRVSTPAYMNVFYVSSTCQVMRLLGNHPVRPRDIVDFPTRESGLAMTVKPPAGDEAFYFIATREPLDFLSGGTGGDIEGEASGIASLNLSPEQFYRRLEDTRGRIDPDSWGARTLRTRIVQH